MTDWENQVRGLQASLRPPAVSAAYVNGPHAQCMRNGCQAGALIETIASSQRLMGEAIDREERRAKKMEPTKALWCEQGGHPFSERDPGRQVLVIITTDGEGGEVEQGRTICGGCAATAGTARQVITRPQLTNGGNGDVASAGQH